MNNNSVNNIVNIEYSVVRDNKWYDSRRTIKEFLNKEEAETLANELNKQETDSMSVYYHVVKNKKIM